MKETNPANIIVAKLRMQLKITANILIGNNAKMKPKIRGKIHKILEIALSFPINSHVRLYAQHKDETAMISPSYILFMVVLTVISLK